MAVVLVLSRNWLDNCKGTSCSGSLTALLLVTPGAGLEPHKMLKRGCRPWEGAQEKQRSLAFFLRRKYS